MSKQTLVIETAKELSLNNGIIVIMDHSDGRKVMEGSLSYHQSASWNNGNMNVFSGKYDLDNGKEIDKNLWTIQEILKSEPDFTKMYKNKKFDLSNAKINNISAEKFLADYIKEDYGNGFNS